MSDKKTYHLTKSDDGWQTKLERGKKASIKGKTKAEVLEKSIELAKKQKDSSLKIHKSDGKFQEERTYPRSKDPFPPKG